MKISQIITKLKEDPDNILNSLDESNTRKLIDYLYDKYHNENISLVSDQLFDYVKEFYEKNYNTKIVDVGAPIKTSSFKFNDKANDKVNDKVTDKVTDKANDKANGKANGKVKLPYYMGSLDKIKPSTGTFNKWVSDYPGPYVISYKLDGISAMLYKKGGQVYMYTRGNGIEGRDISQCIEPMGINTSKLLEGDAIRGELIMSKENFKKIILSQKIQTISEHIKQFIIESSNNELIAIVDSFQPKLKTSDMTPWMTSKETQPIEYSHINNMVVHSKFEGLFCQELERLGKVNKIKSWAKNDHLGFKIWYVYKGEVHNYYPDFIIDKGDNKFIVVETKGFKEDQDEYKWNALKEWCIAVNNNKEYGLWEFKVMLKKEEFNTLLD
jgi:hypothetical protein